MMGEKRVRKLTHGVPGRNGSPEETRVFRRKWPSLAEEKKKIGEEINADVNKERAKAAKAAEKERKKQEAEAVRLPKAAFGCQEGRFQRF